MGDAAALLGVSVDTVRRLVDSGRLAATRSAGGRRRIDGVALARFAATLHEQPDREVIASESARNRLTGIVTRVQRDKVMAQVDMHAGPFRLVSLMSREAADELRLEPGVKVVASVKATNVVVELPAGG